MKPVNVLIVDDSAIVRKVLSDGLMAYDYINVVGTAIDPYLAREKIARHRDIDVILLDIEMPRMDGLTFLKYLMKSYPIPVIIVSSLAKDHNDAVIQAMELGAVDVVPKPGGPYSTEQLIETLAERIVMASSVEMNKVKRVSKAVSAQKAHYTDRILTKISTTKKVIVVGASTGGTSALEILFRDLPKTFPPVVAVIHMPMGFTRSFAHRLDNICEGSVVEAEENMHLEDGHIYIAPGGQCHTIIKASGALRSIHLLHTSPYNNHRPAVDILFESASRYIGKNCLAVLLTGMGRDGADGMKKIHAAGGYTIAQDEKSCIVFGMPKAAIEEGGVSEVLPLDKIARKLIMNLNR